MQAFTQATMALRDAILAVSLLAMLAYTRWHFWWKSGFGRARMAAVLSVSALTVTQLIRYWTGTDYDFSSKADDAIAAVELAALTGVLVWLSYMLFRIIQHNVHRVRDPADASEQARRHLAQTPHATREEIEKLIACWDEVHGGGPPGSGDVP